VPTLVIIAKNTVLQGGLSIRTFASKGLYQGKVAVQTCLPECRIMPAAAHDSSDRMDRPSVNPTGIRRVLHWTDGDGAAASLDLSDLTVRRREIVDQMLERHRPDAVARSGLRPSTVRDHRSAISAISATPESPPDQTDLVELPGGRVARGSGPPAGEARR
jgi:hypothetical protein